MVSAVCDYHSYWYTGQPSEEISSNTTNQKASVCRTFLVAKRPKWLFVHETFGWSYLFLVLQSNFSNYKFECKWLDAIEWPISLTNRLQRQPKNWRATNPPTTNKRGTTSRLTGREKALLFVERLSRTWILGLWCKRIVVGRWGRLKGRGT